MSPGRAETTSLPALRRGSVDAVLAAASHLLGMEVVFVGALTEDRFTFARVRTRDGEPPWSSRIAESASLARTDSLCHQLLAGAAPASCDVPIDPRYGPVAARLDADLRSYVGVPIRGADGALLGTLCGIDRDAVPVDSGAVDLLADLAAVLSASLAEGASGDAASAEEGVVIRRTEHGWQVAGEPAESLPAAMSLADLFAGDVAPPQRPGRRDTHPQSEVARLHESVAQLEHALAARVAVEQAIGVLAERAGSAPREAFELLRGVARRSGRRVHELARDVVASVTDPAHDLAPELAHPQRRAAGGAGAQQPAPCQRGAAVPLRPVPGPPPGPRRMPR